MVALKCFACNLHGPRTVTFLRDMMPLMTWTVVWLSWELSQKLQGVSIFKCQEETLTRDISSMIIAVESNLLCLPKK